MEGHCGKGQKCDKCLILINPPKIEIGIYMDPYSTFYVSFQLIKLLCACIITLRRSLLIRCYCIVTFCTVVNAYNGIFSN